MNKGKDIIAIITKKNQWHGLPNLFPQEQHQASKMQSIHEALNNNFISGKVAQFNTHSSPEGNFKSI